MLLRPVLCLACNDNIGHIDIPTLDLPLQEQVLEESDLATAVHRYTVAGNVPLVIYTPAQQDRPGARIQYAGAQAPFYVDAEIFPQGTNIVNAAHLCINIVQSVCVLKLQEIALHLHILIDIFTIVGCARLVYVPVYFYYLVLHHDIFHVVETYRYIIMSLETISQAIVVLRNGKLVYLQIGVHAELALPIASFNVVKREIIVRAPEAYVRGAEMIAVITPVKVEATFPEVRALLV